MGGQIESDIEKALPRLDAMIDTDDFTIDDLWVFHHETGELVKLATIPVDQRKEYFELYE